MRSKIFWLIVNSLVFFGLGNAHLAYAQAQASSSSQGLEELKNYSPPPMFGGPAPQPETVPPPPVFQPPAKILQPTSPLPVPAVAPPAPQPRAPAPLPQVTSQPPQPLPSAENLLNHPVTIAPTGAAAAVPIVPTHSVETAPPPEFIAPPAPAPSPKPRAQTPPPARAKSAPKKDVKEKEKEKQSVRKESKPNVKKSPEKKEPDKKEIKKEIKKEVPTKKTTALAPAPKIQAAKTRPVEQESLPPLPEMPQAPAPSVPEKIIDQTLQNRLIDADADDVVKTVAPSAKSVLRLPQKSQNTSQQPLSKAIPLPLVTVPFQGDRAELQSAQTSILRSDVLPRLKSDKATRLQILAYATGEANDGQSAARRTSLARALNVRAWFLEQGVEASRMDIRALGANTLEKPMDRVDLLVIK